MSRGPQQRRTGLGRWRFTIADSLLAHIEPVPKPGQDYASLRTAYLMVTGDKANAAVVASLHGRRV
jgi:hypothetical protein